MVLGYGQGLGGLYQAAYVLSDLAGHDCYFVCLPVRLIADLGLSCEFGGKPPIIVAVVFADVQDVAFPVDGRGFICSLRNRR